MIDVIGRRAFGHCSRAIPKAVRCSPRRTHSLFWISFPGPCRSRDFQSEPEFGPRGKQLKEDFKARHKQKQASKTEEFSPAQVAKQSKWELSVGLEIHAQLNTDRKLFSESRTSVDDAPNTNVTFYDLAFPGTQPVFQQATVIPALRAAIALQCSIQTESNFDRKHYFYPDQPAGYQITQYYRPFAVDGCIQLDDPDLDGSASPVASMVRIKQIQLEQDTAKSNALPPSTTLIDFNRVGHPLIEIITLPDLHTPQAAAACARKIFSILQAVNAVDTGVEMGGLRADVNVSVAPKGSNELGQRTEIKNVSSFKAIEQAIIAERDRQIELLENGGIVQSETRGWTLGEMQTRRLRGKEGEVDYRYMPDPDVPPLLIDHNLIDHIRQSLPPLPDDLAADLVSESGLSQKDARTLVALDDGDRLDYYDEVCAEWSALIASARPDKQVPPETGKTLTRDMMRIAGNWIIHEMGGLLSSRSQSEGSVNFTTSLIPATSMATILNSLSSRKITGTSAKQLLEIIFQSDGNKDASAIMKEHDMLKKDFDEAWYRTEIMNVVSENAREVEAIRKGQVGKLGFLVGLVMRKSSGKADAAKLRKLLLDAIVMDGGTKT